MTDAFDQLSPDDRDPTPAPDFAAQLRDTVAKISGGGDPPASGGWHLAQLNLGVFRASLDSPEMAPFVAGLDRINQIADESPGFVWRLVGDDGVPSSYVEVPGIDDPLIASNLSVWTDLDALRTFMYRTDHASYLRRRNEWFDHQAVAMTVAWWIPAGSLPTLLDAVQRLEHFRSYGPSDIGFALAKTIPEPPLLDETMRDRR